MSLMSVMLFVFFVLGLSLLVSGSNSYDQILLGYTIGVILSFMLHFKVKIFFKYLPVYLSRDQSRLLHSYDDFDENFTKFYVKWHYYAFSILALVFVPVVVAAVAWSHKSIYLIDGSFNRIIKCTGDHFKALQYGFFVYVLH
jgi:hypothetical protein